ncbi:unnamed protein product [Durusdinium trenchii]|uniref:Subtilisin n=1 Tax=Durusdinium trenchii TaxID=1381693 RepID=A0ABP0H5R2_9DINO
MKKDLFPAIFHRSHPSLHVSWIIWSTLLLGAAQVPTELPGLVSFYDTDLDLGEIEGVFQFVKATSEANIDNYNVYWGSSATVKLLPFIQLTANGLPPSYTVPANTLVPSSATHFLVYSSNSFGEAATASSLAFTDRHLPVEGPSAVAFTDTDEKHGEVTGTITITRASSESDITDYVLYWGSSPTSFLSYIVALPVASSPLTYDFNGALVPTGGTHILAYSMNAHGLNEASIASVSAYDRALPEENATSLSFTDLDLVKNEIGGFITVGAAVDESIITGYALYFATSSDGPPGPFVGLATATGSDVAYFLPTDTAMPSSYPYLLVRSRSADGEMDNGIGIPLVDRYVPQYQAQAISFQDEDLLSGFIAGTVEVTAAATETDITKYGLYFADMFQQPVSLIVDLEQGSYLNYSIPAGTSKPSTAEYLLVLSGNHFGYMTTGVSMTLVDSAYPINLPSQIQFDDLDMDAGEIGGSLTVMRATDESDVTSYTAYYGSSSTADSSTQVQLIGEISIASLPGASTSAVFTISLNTIPPTATHLLAFSKNAVGESLSGISTSLVDKTNFFPTVAVSSVAFADADSVVQQVGGSVTWLAPANTAGLTHYSVVFAQDASGTGRLTMCASIAIGIQSCAIPLGTSLGSGLSTFTHIIVFTNNGFGEGPGQAITLTDLAAPVAIVSSVTFVDTDPGTGQVGGTVAWAAPANPAGASQFTEYRVYLTDDGFMPTNLQLLGQSAYGIDTFLIADGQVLGNFTHLGVFTKNAAGEALTGSYVAVVDRFLPLLAVLNLFFVDSDLTVGEIGGGLIWDEPADVSSITHYSIRAECGSQLVVLGQVSVGTTSFQVPSDTPLGNCSSLRVVAQNDLGDSQIFAERSIEDKSIESCPNVSEHSFSSSQWRLVPHKGATSKWRLQGVRFYEDALCTMQIATVPDRWPRRANVLPGAPFAVPGAPVLHEIFKLGVPAGGAERPWWSSGVPCPPYEPGNSSAPHCAIGYRWESDVTGTVHGLGTTGQVKREGHQIHCVELDQSTVPGAFICNFCHTLLLFFWVASLF